MTSVASVVRCVPQYRAVLEAISGHGHDPKLRRRVTGQMRPLKELKHEACAHQFKDIPPEFTEEELVHYHRRLPGALAMLTTLHKVLDVTGAVQDTVGVSPRAALLTTLHRVACPSQPAWAVACSLADIVCAHA
jgi:hypothetical protein